MMMKRVVVVKRVLLFVLGAGMVLAGLFAPSASADSSTPDITVTHTAGAGSSQCLPAAMASSAVLIDSGTSWTIRITATAPICGPVAAAIYQMPNNMFYPWPQQLLQSQSIDVTPGVTDVTFTKTCTPTQFDLVSGATPPAINPSTGPMVNLLYMFPWSGIQYWPTASCQGSATTTTTGGPTSTTTTVAPTTTTTLAPANTTVTTVATGATGGPTTTSPTAVLPSTLNAGTTTTTTPNAVEAATETKAAQPATVGDLAFTGASEQLLILGGFVLMAFGIATTVAARRRAAVEYLTAEYLD